MEQMIPVTIDGVQVEVPAGSTVLEAAHKANVKIPTLCFLKDINETANCRICVVDCGGRTLQAACVLPVTPGMVVKTNTPAVREARRMNLELILSNHDKKCLTCVRSENCELQTWRTANASPVLAMNTKWTAAPTASSATTTSASCAAAAWALALTCRRWA